MRISGTTTLLGLIGTPVEHSKSPAMYNHCFQKFGLDWAYLAFGIPQEKAGDAVQAIRTLCRVEEAWVPDEIGSSLYFRPLAIATTPKLGVHASGNYLFCVLASPAGTYYPTGMEPVRIYVEPHYIRAAEGGTGFTKCAGNYAGAALAGDRAEKMGFNQVLWLDGHDRKYVEEMGSMNGFFVIGGELYTAAAAAGTDFYYEAAVAGAIPVVYALRESMAGDVWFHPDLARTVCVDIRYVMWIIDKYAEADWLLDEMKFEK